MPGRTVKCAYIVEWLGALQAGIPPLKCPGTRILGRLRSPWGCGSSRTCAYVEGEGTCACRATHAQVVRACATRFQVRHCFYKRDAMEALHNSGMALIQHIAKNHPTTLGMGKSSSIYLYTTHWHVAVWLVYADFLILRVHRTTHNMLGQKKGIH